MRRIEKKMHEGTYARRLLISSDTAGYGSGTDKRHEAFQAGFVAAHERAAVAAGRDRGRWDVHPEGDGELAVLPPTESEPAVVDDYVRALAEALRRRNNGLAVEDRLRLRVAVHFGVAYPAANGFAGQAVVEVSRLIAWQPLKRVLHENQNVNLVLILSGRVFSETVRQGHTSYTVEAFAPVRVREKEFDGEAWIWSPDIDVRKLSYSTEPAQPRGDKPAGTSVVQTAEVITNNSGPVDARGAVFGISRG